MLGWTPSRCSTRKTLIFKEAVELAQVAVSLFEMRIILDEAAVSPVYLFVVCQGDSLGFVNKLHAMLQDFFVLHGVYVAADNNADN